MSGFCNRKYHLTFRWSLCLLFQIEILCWKEPSQRFKTKISLSKTVLIPVMLHFFPCKSSHWLQGTILRLSTGLKSALAQDKTPSLLLTPTNLMQDRITHTRKSGSVFQSNLNASYFLGTAFKFQISEAVDNASSFLSYIINERKLTNPA